MFKSIVRSVVSVGATTNFEKARLQITYKGDFEPPNEKDLTSVLKTLAGEDKETKPNIAFNVIIAKLQSSDSRGYWNYLVKNLVILDRMLDDKRFVHDVSELELDYVENFKDSKTKMRIDELVREYYRFVKAKARLYADPKCSLNVAKTAKKDFFLKLSTKKILEDSKILDCFIDIAFNVTKTGIDGHLKYPLNQYVFLLILYTLLSVYSTQYMAMIIIIDRYFDTDITTAKECLDAYRRFLRNTEGIVRFTNNHQFIPGFQVSLHEFHNSVSDAKVQKSMEEYIQLSEKKQKEPEFQTVNFKFDDFVMSNFEEDYIKISNTFDSKTIAEEVAREFKKNAQNQSQTNPIEEFEFNPETELKIEESQKSPVMTNVVSQDSQSEPNKANSNRVLYSNSLPPKLKEEKVSPTKSRHSAGTGQSDDGSPLLSDDHNLPQYGIVKPLPSFVKMFCLDEKDELFDDFKNFYSPEFNDEVENVYREYLGKLELKKGNSGVGFGEPIGVVKNRCDEDVEENQLFMFEDFNVVLFESYKNTYSKEYEDGGGKGNTLWNAATSFFRKS